MTDRALGKPLPAERGGLALTAALIIGFASAVAARVMIGGSQVSTSVPAAIVFSMCLIVLVWAAGLPAWKNKSLLLGIPGGLILCLAPIIMMLTGHLPPLHAGLFIYWAPLASFVALSEELFLRGVLFDSIAEWRGQNMAIVMGAILFALLHYPLYGIGSLPLDFAVGIWLGALRAISGNVAAPAAAHIIADLVGWWI